MPTCVVRETSCVNNKGQTSMYEMEWTRKAVEILIAAYREEECLFNTEDPLYHNKHARKQKLLEVTKKVSEVLRGVTAEDCKTKFSSLRSHYGAECRKIRSTESSGAGASSVYKPNVWWFPLMHFLKDYIIPRNSSTNIPDKIVPASYRADTLECEHMDHSYTVQTKSGSHDSSNINFSFQKYPASHSSQTVPIQTTIESFTDTPVVLDVDVSAGAGPSATSECNTPTPASPYARQGKKQRRDEEGQLLMATVLEKVSAKMDMSSEDPIAKFVASELKKLECSPIIHLRTKNKILKALMDGQSELIAELEK